jgi:hypothetical protein
VKGTTKKMKKAKKKRSRTVKSGKGFEDMLRKMKSMQRVRKATKAYMMYAGSKEKTSGSWVKRKTLKTELRIIYRGWPLQEGKVPRWTI